MSLSCPYRHVSYATWRLNVIRTLCQSFDEPRPSRSALIRREYQRPYVRKASISKPAAARNGDSPTTNDGSTPAIPPAAASTKKDTRKGDPFSPYSEPGRQAIKDLLSDLKKASKKIQLGNENGESFRFGLHRSLNLDSFGDTNTQDSTSERPSIDLPLRKYHSTQGESLGATSLEGHQPVRGSLTELQEESKNVHRRDGKGGSSHLAGQEPPPTLKSPIIAQVANAARRREERKEHPSYRRIKGLKNNPFAEILASPIRQCQGSGARLPSDLLLDFGYVKNQKDGKIYLMPAELADVDALEAKLVAELTALEDQSRIPDNGMEVKGDTGSAGKDGTMEDIGDAQGPASSSREAAQKTTNHLATTRRYTPVQSRLLSNITFLRLVTNKIVQPSKKATKFPAPATFETIAGKVGSLIHFDARMSHSNAQHYLQNKNRFDSTVGGQDAVTTDPDSPPAEQAKARFNMNKLQWQADISVRIAGIMRKRICAALKLLADSESAAKSQPLPTRPSGAIPLPFPQNGVFLGDELRRLTRAASSNTASTSPKIRAVSSEPKQGPSSRGSSSAASDADLPVPPPPHPFLPIQEAEYHPLGHSEWLPGSIFLRIGEDDVETPTSSDSSSSSLPPLPSNNPLVPPMISVLDTYRFPVFSLHALFTNASAPETSDLEDLNSLIRRDSIFQHPDHQMSGGERDTRRPGHLLLILPVPGPAKAVIEEVWRLWRYLGGRNMDFSFFSENEGGSAGADNNNKSNHYKGNEDMDMEHDDEKSRPDRKVNRHAGARRKDKLNGRPQLRASWQ
ncbi:uncharacterized protein Z520_10644 [Fonsecaea multimorphosa CBS 102226]|uniref:Uncharacterized protein n=1 Tax=Fonsecaea multimorphosa CBS 102226 TaxID=1442371 RepID=A0A0D2KAZ8_9EURO|nr:uncharacterized protein Z520_10644 [Fonsecaea multimorphosa CBS 102226]KIX93738.1 hypothetical protein Z520_10644 [Fonsecaea multimorphosa CBS 102226]OAL19846.1 hypothetical protein AYO22_09373 [Fonsecaea multimorphosa]